MMVPRRVVVTTGSDGRSIARIDATAPYSFAARPVAMHQLWLTTATPADPAVDALASTKPSVPLAQPPAGGTLFEVCTFAPGAESPMHRTDTIDYVTVLSWKIDLDTQEGPPVRLIAGDCVVQLATAHRWANRSDQPCSLAVVCVSASTDASASGDIELVG